MIISREYDFLFQSVREWFNRPEQIAHYTAEISRGLTIAEQYLLSSLAGKGSVLDIGCGAGRACFELAEREYKVTGIDVSEGLLSVARKISMDKGTPIDFIHTEGVWLPFQDNTFEVVTGFKILCYIPTRELRETYLAEIFRVLKPGGTCVMTQNVVPSESISDALDEFYWSSPASQFGILEEGDSFPLGVGYVRWFTEDDLLAELKATEFHLELFKSDKDYCGDGYIRLIKLLKDSV